MNLDEWREQIDAVDNEIVGLLARRVEIAREISRLKRVSGTPIFDPERELQIFARVRDLSPATLAHKALDQIYETILAESKRIQADEQRAEACSFAQTRGPRAAIQGVRGSYSAAAAAAALGANVSLIECDTFNDAFAVLRSGAADYAVIPKENSIIGEIASTKDLLRAKDIEAVDAVSIKIEHALAGVEGSTLDSVKRIYSHPEALRQCTAFLASNSQISVHEAADTAASIRDVVGAGDVSAAAICSTSAAELYGGVIIERDIANEADNTTTFALLRSKAIQR